MSTWSYLGLKLVHMFAMALWIGGPIFVPCDVRQTLERGKPHTDALPARMRAVERVLIVAALVTALSGIGLVFAGGGLAAMPWRIHAGLALTLASFVIGATLASPAQRRLWRALQSDDASGISRSAAASSGGSTSSTPCGSSSWR